MKTAKEQLLNLTDKGLDGYKFFMPELEQIDEHRCRPILNPFYDDNKASLSIYFNEATDRWQHKDFGEPTYQGDVFDFASNYYDLDVQRDFTKIIDQMASDLGIRLIKDSILPKSNRLSVFGYQLIYDEDTCYIEAYSYFKKYAITFPVLRQYKVKAIRGYKYLSNDNEIQSVDLSNKKLTIAYDDVYFAKIYSPDPKSFRYVGHKDKDFVFGLKQIASRSIKNNGFTNPLILTGGEKDVLVLTSLGYDAVCFNSETARIPRSFYHENEGNFFSAYKNIVILYDVDETGRKRAAELKEQFSDWNLSVCTLPDALIEKGGKDVADYMLLGFSPEDLHSLIRECIADTAIVLKETVSPVEEDIIDKDKDEVVQAASTNQLSTPPLPEEIYDQLPEFFQLMCSPFTTSRDKDLVLLSALGVTSSLFPKVRGVYDGSTVGCNLYLYVSAPAASGKGVMKWARNLGVPTQSYLKRKFFNELRKHEQALNEYRLMANDPNIPMPKEPKQTTLFIPANTSTAKMIEFLSSNQNFGIIFENEGDTLSNALKSDWGDFSDILRKAFQHEPVSMARRGNKEFLEVNNPHLSVVLSGTPNQINKLIESVENGFFSRFLFYDFEAPVIWLDQFGKGDNSIENVFVKLATDLRSIWKKQETANECTIVLEEMHIREINQFFSERLEELHNEYGGEIVASVKRFCLSLYRIAMIFTAFRVLENNDWLPEKVIVGEKDVRLSLTIIDTLFTHLTTVYSRLKKTEHLSKLNTQQRKLYQILPDSFSTREYETIIDEAGDLVAGSNSKVFILGCIISDTPEKLKESFAKLIFELENDMYFLRHRKQIMEEGFHACSNHTDIYSHFVRYIPALNFRCYFLVVDKTSDFYKELIIKQTPDQIYNSCIRMLLRDRLIRRKLSINHLVFEQNLSNPTSQRLENRRLEIVKIIEDMNKDFISRKLIQNEIVFSVKLLDKNENILAIVDYVTHILLKVFEGKNGKVENYMKLNYQLIEPKIACIHLVDKNKYLKIRKNAVDIHSLLIK